MMNQKQFMLHLDNQLQDLLDEAPPFVRTKERAFIAWCLLHAADLDISSADAFDAIVDGSQEKGIDAIYVPESGGRIVILSTKYHKDPSGNGIKKNDLVKFFTGVDWLLDGDLQRITDNNRFRARAEEFREAYYDFDYSNVGIIFAATAANSTSKEEDDEIERYQKRLADRGAPFVINVLSTLELADALTESVHRGSMSILI
jgi:hypothetical protein